METSNETESSPSSSSSNTIIVNNSSATLSAIEVDDKQQQADLNLELEKINNVSLSQIESYLKADLNNLLPAPLE